MTMKVILCISAALTLANAAKPPFFTNKVGTARFMVHEMDWAVLSTLSTMIGQEGTPFGNPISVSDGATNSTGTGIPYFYATLLDQSMQDIFNVSLSNVNNSMVSLTFSEAQTSYCTEKVYDPEDPRCARLVLTGTFVNVTDAKEMAQAKEALFSRHPQMSEWPSDHSWFFGKLEIKTLWLLDFFGGAAMIPLADYLNYTTTK